jgi:ribosomal protein S18 acetylase RimI-like enzyme
MITPGHPPGVPTDTGAVRRLLLNDPYWSAYALGDLDPRRAPHCRWFTRGSSIALLYDEFDEPILFAAGEPDVLDALPDLEACHLQIPEHFLPAVMRRLRLQWSQPVDRMSLAPEAFMPSPGDGRAERLDERHEAEIRKLYEDGTATGEEPDFFMRSQLQDGTFYGIRADGRLVAAGGTHLYSEIESVGTIGNVYTLREYRGRGCGAAVASAVARELIQRGTRIIALNVRSRNDAARRVYQRLGFRFHARFFEGRAGPPRD